MVRVVTRPWPRSVPACATGTCRQCSASRAQAVDVVVVVGAAAGHEQRQTADLGSRLHVIASNVRRPSAQVDDLCRLALSVERPIFGHGGAYCCGVAPDPGNHSSDTSRQWTRPGVFLSDRLHTRSIFSSGSPMTDVAYLCHNCGSVHEVESIRENLILDLRTAASYELSGQRGMDPRARFLLRWRMAWGLAQALWPPYSHHPRLAWARRLVQGPPAPVSDRPVPCRAATGGSDAPADNPALAGTHGRLASISVAISTPAPPPRP
jgi:hypothetical protein